MISGINEILREDSALTTLLGSNKIYPMVVPANVSAPYIATSLASRGATNTKTESSSLDYPLINVNIHAQSYDDIEEIGEAVREALDGIHATTDAGYNFSRIWFFNELDRPDLYTTERPLYARSIQFYAELKR